MPLLTKNDDLPDSSSEYDSLPEVSLIDVYDLASDIGKEFEKIISIHGNDFVNGLMPKVISVLELLEKISNQTEHERVTIEELRNTISLLEQEKREKAIDRLRYEKEIEQLEENWKKESQELLLIVNRLQEENKKLVASLKEREEQSTSQCSLTNTPDWELLQKVRESNERQRELLRTKEKELQDKLSETESLQSQVERLTESNKELRRKQRHISQQMRCLVEERAELQATLQEQTRTLNMLNKKLGLAQRDNQDLVQSQSVETLDLKNKVLIDINDPNRPRFTIAELKEILSERNELKARVSDLEDELALYHPKTKLPVATSVETPVENLSENNEADLPVQGPLPYEPEDAPWKRTKKESGIRKLFSTITSLPRLLAPRTVEGVI